METDWKKKYEEALNKAQKLHGTVVAGRDFLAEIFPELADSDDERIRKCLVDMVKRETGFTGFPSQGQVLAYLEKQKESTWTEEDEIFRKHILPRILDPKGWTMEQIEADRKLLKEFVEHQKNKWLEKQKESLHITEMCKENAGSFTDEDERHRKWILEYLYDGLRKADEQFKDQFKSAIAWLEKQKEQKLADDKAFEEWIDDCYQCSKEDGGEIVMSEAEFKNWSRGIKNMYHQKPAECAHQAFRDALFDCIDDTVVTYIDDYTPESRIELIQKQTDCWAARLHAIAIKQKLAWGEDDDRPFNNVLNGLKYAYEDLTNHKSYDSAKDVKEAYDWMVSQFKYFCPNLQSKPAEWSEKDNIGWDEALACVTRAEKAAKNEEELQNAVTAENWLKEIKCKYYVHPVKPEWSEEEKDKLNSIERLIVNANAHGNYLIGDKEATDLQHFIRSIVKPTTNLAEWSEEDKEMVRRAIFYTEQYRTNYGDTKESEECFNWLLDLHRNIRPPFHWKPSEEQIEALRVYLYHPQSIRNSEDVKIKLVESLYKDLDNYFGHEEEIH